MLKNLILLSIVVLSGCSSISTGQRGVVLSFGHPTGEVKTEGFYTYNPIGTSIVPLNVQTVTDKVTNDAVTSDSQKATTEVALLYHLDPTPSKLVSLYDTYLDDYDERLINPAILDSVKSATGKFSAPNLIANRSTVSSDIENFLKNRLNPQGIIVDQVFITNFHFSPEYEAAIENKAVEQQRLQTVQLQAQQKVETARGDAQAQALQRVSLTPALLQSKALDVQQKAVDVQAKAVEKWDGKLPEYVGGNSMPFINLGNSSPTQGK